MEYFPLFLRSPCVWQLVWCCVQSSSANTPHSFLLLGDGASPSCFPSPRGCSCSVPSFPLPSPGPAVCAPHPTVSLSVVSSPFGADGGFQPCPGCGRHSFGSRCIPQTPAVFPLPPSPGGLLFQSLSCVPCSSEEIRAVQCCGGPRHVPLL